ncbi:MAG: T9SS type A sorting domain-containing protein [Chitinophagales bacterium]
MRSCILFLISICTFSSSRAQDFKWANAYGNLSYDDGFSIAIDQFGNVYCAGRFVDTVDFDPGPGTFNLIGNGSWDMFITKLDNSGNLIWAISFGSEFLDDWISITIDDENNLIMTGTFTGTVDFDPGPDVFNLIAAPAPDIFVLKLDAESNFINAVRIGGITPLTDIGVSISHDTSENIYVTGWFELIADFDPGPGIYTLTSNGERDIYILKLDKDLNFIWAKNFGSDEFGDSGYSIFIDDSQNILVTGYYTDTVDFDPGPDVYLLTPFGSDYEHNTFILKLDKDGNFILAKAMGGRLYDCGYSIIADHAENIYTCGYFNDTADFDPGPDIYNLVSFNEDQDIFVCKLSSGGDFIWAKRFGGEFIEYAFAIVADDTGNIYITGEYWETVDFDPGPGVYELTDENGSNAFIVKLNSDGEFLWVKEIENGKYDDGRDLCLDNTGAIYWTGSFGQTADFDPGDGVYELTSFMTNPNDGHCDIFIMKLGTCGLVNIQPTDANSFIGGDAMFVAYSFDPLASYQWQEDTGTGFINLIDGGIYNGATNDTLIITGLTLDMDHYKYRSIINDQPCSDTSYSALLTVNDYNFISEPIFDGVEVFPNPSNGIFTIAGIGNLHIYNTIGELVYSSNLTELRSQVNLVGNGQGIYFLQLIKDYKTQSAKLFVYW